MEIQFACPRPKSSHVCAALFLAAICCNVFATLDWLDLLPLALVGALLSALPLPKSRKARCVLWSGLVLWLLLRFPVILDGIKLLANRMFALSAQTQSYEYDYFAVSGQSAVEAVLWLSILAGGLCALLGNRFNVLLCGGWMAAMAYFGVTPGPLWLALLGIGAFAAALPEQQRWFYGLLTAALVVSIALASVRLFPEPSKTVSILDDRLRDTLAAAPVTYAQTPVPTEVPEPEIVPQPKTELEQPDHGVQRAVINILFWILAALTLALLFVPAVLKDRAAKKSEHARTGLADPEPASAIRAMYLYAQKWRKLSEDSVDIPGDVYEIWQEAAYSEHTMTEVQRQRVHDYMKETAETVWAAANWRKKLRIRYRICL